jgi:hypothetical protein
MTLNDWITSARWSVLLSMAFGLLYAGLYWVHYLNTGRGSWQLLYQGGINGAGCVAAVVLLLMVFGCWLRLEAES